MVSTTGLVVRAARFDWKSEATDGNEKTLHIVMESRQGGWCSRRCGLLTNGLVIFMLSHSPRSDTTRALAELVSYFLALR